MKKGFTLVELVIVIAIVIVLSVVSVPIYNSYVDKARMSEGYALLGACLTAQKAYYSEYGNFLRCQNCHDYTIYEPIVGIDARGNKYFTKFSVSASLSSDAKIGFISGAKKDPNLITNGKSYLGLNYNITTGATFYEF